MPDSNGHVVMRLRAFLDGEMSPAEASSVRAHCAGCSDCARTLEGFRAVGTALREGDPAAFARSSWWPAIDARLRRRRDPRWRTDPRWGADPRGRADSRGHAASRRRAAYAAGISALAAAGLFLGLQLGAMSGAATSDGATAWSSASPSLQGESAGNLTDLYLISGAEEDSGR